MVQAEIGNNAINPGVKRALKTEVPDVPVGLQEGLLIDIVRVGVGAGQVQRQAQHGLVILAHQCLESGTVSALGGANQFAIIDPT
jgi:hypothetical protein